MAGVSRDDIGQRSVCTSGTNPTPAEHFVLPHQGQLLRLHHGANTREAVKRGEFLACFRPVVSLRTAIMLRLRHLRSGNIRLRV